MSSTRRRRPTLDDVAEAVGVSRATVSNAYNRPDQLSAKLREEILRTAGELGYPGPNPTARSLATSRTGAIAFLLDQSLSAAFSDPALSITLDALAKAVDPTGHALLLLPGREAQDGPPAERVLAAQADIAVAYSLAEGTAALDAVHARGLPLVIIDQPPLPATARVSCDDRGGAALAARHLVELGHRRFGILSAPRVPLPAPAPAVSAGSSVSPGAALSAGAVSAGPAGSAGAAGPALSAGPAGAAGPPEPSLPTGSAGPAVPAESAESAVSAAPAEPAVSTESALPAVSTESALPAVSTESALPAGPAGPAMSGTGDLADSLSARPTPPTTAQPDPASSDPAASSHSASSPTSSDRATPGSPSPNIAFSSSAWSGPTSYSATSSGRESPASAPADPDATSPPSSSTTQPGTSLSGTIPPGTTSGPAASDSAPANPNSAASASSDAAPSGPATRNPAPRDSATTASSPTHASPDTAPSDTAPSDTAPPDRDSPTPSSPSTGRTPSSERSGLESAQASAFHGTRERLAGYLGVLSSAGITDVTVSEAPWLAASTARASATELLTAQPRPTALLCMSDQLAFAAIAAARKLGLRVPEDVSIVGFDDTPQASWSDPPLTTVRQDLAGKGRTAGDLVLRLLDGDAPPAPVELPVSLVVRESTAAI